MKKQLTKKTILALAMVSLTFGSFAQNFYAKLNGGYNFGIKSETMVSETGLGSVTNYEAVNLNLCKGTQFGGAIGYMLNKNIGTELGVAYLIGGKTQLKRNSTDPDGFSFASNAEISAKMLSFSPSLILTPGFGKINPYAKLGLFIGLPTLTSSSDFNMSMTIFDSTLTSTSSQTFVMNGGLAIGFQGAIGIEYNFNDNISFFGELSHVNTSYSPKKGERTASKQDGKENLSTLSTRDKKTEFVKSYSEDSSNLDENAPSKAIAPRLPLSSLGLNIGVKYNF